MQYVAVSALSHDGLVRDHNEDSLVVGAWTLCAATTLTPQTFYLPIGAPVVVAVADGLGGHPAGGEASSVRVLDPQPAAGGCLVGVASGSSGVGRPRLPAQSVAFSVRW
jgi:serine/threonine protein phosphatase PrpC